MELYYKIFKITNEIINDILNEEAMLPKESKDALAKAHVDLIPEYTRVLKNWFLLPKEQYGAGELGLAYIHLGALVESWIRLFYIIYAEDYNNDSEKKYELDDHRLNEYKIQEFSKNRFFDFEINGDEELYDWCNRIREYRNGVHLLYVFNEMSYEALMNDLNIFLLFLKKFDSTIPPLNPADYY